MCLKKSSYNTVFTVFVEKVNIFSLKKMIIAVVWIETKEKVFYTNARPSPTNLLHTNMISVLTISPLC